MLNNLIKDIKNLGNLEKAKNARRFFKESYTETKFLGLTMSEQRSIAKKYSELPLSKLQELLDSNIHEYKMVAGLILIHHSKEKPEETFNFYIKNAKRFNNWDLVDVSCSHIVGKFLLDKNRKTIYDLAISKNLWEKRIAIVSTQALIKNNELGDTLKISEILLKDKHDLIHKAVGWMLREVGKKEVNVLKDFLKTNYSKIPRTTLRYAIEKFDKKEKKEWLKGKKVWKIL